MDNGEVNCETEPDNVFDNAGVPIDQLLAKTHVQEHVVTGELLQHIYCSQQVLVNQVFDILAWRPYILGAYWAVAYCTGVGTGLFVGWWLFSG